MAFAAVEKRNSSFKSVSQEIQTIRGNLGGSDKQTKPVSAFETASQGLWGSLAAGSAG